MTGRRTRPDSIRGRYGQSEKDCLALLAIAGEDA